MSMDTTFPPNIQTYCQETPWRSDPKLLTRPSENPSLPYKKIKLTPEDNPFKFVHDYFHASNPKNRILKNVFLIVNERLQTVFENSIPSMEREAKNPSFKPQWKEMKNPIQRETTIKRFKDISSPFSPVTISWKNGTKETFHNVRVIPAWHGTDIKSSESICESGLAFFGKHEGHEGKSTDKGFFGSGIYLTTNSRYATKIYSKDGILVLGWVSVRGDPFPVVADIPPPQKCSDMTMLEGKGAFKNYNAHYIPVVSIDPKNEECAIYYPCVEGQKPHCDEIVVFQQQHTLVNFVVELDILLTNPMKEPEKTIAILRDLILKLLENEAVKNTPSLFEALEKNATVLISLDPSKPLNADQEQFYGWARSLIDEANKVRTFVSDQITKKLNTISFGQIERPPVSDKTEVFEREGDTLDPHRTIPASTLKDNFIHFLQKNYKAELPFIKEVSAKVEKNANGGYKFTPMKHPEDYENGTNAKEYSLNEFPAKIKIDWKMIVEKEKGTKKIITHTEYYNVGIELKTNEQSKGLFYAVMRTKAYIQLMKATINPQNDEIYSAAKGLVDRVASGKISYEIPYPHSWDYNPHSICMIGDDPKFQFIDSLSKISKKNGKTKKQNIEAIVAASWLEDGGKVFISTSQEKLMEMFKLTKKTQAAVHRKKASCNIN